MTGAFNPDHPTSKERLALHLHIEHGYSGENLRKMSKAEMSREHGRLTERGCKWRR